MRRRMEKCVAAALVAVALSAARAESTFQGVEDDGSMHLSTVSAGNRVHTKIPSVQTVHAFYYMWYGNPETDGEYKHWNHEVRGYLPFYPPGPTRRSKAACYIIIHGLVRQTSEGPLPI